MSATKGEDIHMEGAPCLQIKLLYEEQSLQIHCVNGVELLLRIHCMRYGLSLSSKLFGLTKVCGAFGTQSALWILKTWCRG